jgi:biopolymer transport protein ExbD
MAARQRREEEDPEINITPMLDIVFIMLIFFIVTTSFVTEPGISPRKPVAETATEKSRGNVLIAISQSGQIWMDKRSVELSQVRAMVEAAMAENPESSAVIIADEEADSGILIDLMDQIRLGGIATISIAAEPGSG